MRRRVAVVVAGAFVVLALPLWVVRYPPLVDYPNHLARAFILAHADSATLRSFYEPNWAPAPYLLMDAILVPAQRLMPLPFAGRILLTIAVLGLPLSVCFFLRAANPGAELLAAYSLLLCYNAFFRSGFVNWQLSLSLCFLTLGIWLRFVRCPTWSLWIGLLAAATALYFAHIVNFAVAGFAILVHGIVARSPLQQIASSLLPFAPGALLYLYWERTAHSVQTFEVHMTARKLVNLADPLRTYSRGLDVVLIPALAASVALLLWRNRELVWHRPWLLTAGALALVCLISPTTAGAFLDSRLACALMLVSLAVASPGPRLGRVVPWVLLLFLLQLGYVGSTFVRAQPELEALARSFAAVPRGSRVLPIVQGHREPLPEQIFAHFWAYGVIDREWYVPYLFHSRGLQPQPLVLRISTYTPDGFGWRDYGTDDLDWKQIAGEYDFVWAYNAPRFAPALGAIGQRVFADGQLSVYKISAVRP